MSTDTQKTTQLRYEDRDGIVVVTSDDEDRFAITVKEAIHACRVYQREEIFAHQFNILLKRLAIWLRTRQDEVADAFVTVRDNGLLFLVVRKSPHYDAGFEDDLTELDLEVAQDPNLDLIRLSVLAIPHASDDAIASFLVPGLTLEYPHAE